MTQYQMNLSTRAMFVAISTLLIFIILSGSLVGTAAAQGVTDAPDLGSAITDSPGEVGLNEEGEITTTVELPETPADWSGELDATLYVDGNAVGTQPITLSDGESTDVGIAHQFEEAGEKDVYVTVAGTVTRDARFSTISAEVEATTRTVTVDVTQPDAPDLGSEITDSPGEVSLNEEGEITTTVELPETPADWSGELDATLYVDGNAVGTQPITLSDGESTDVGIAHQFEEAGEKDVYVTVAGTVTRDAQFSTISAEVEATTRTVTVGVSEQNIDLIADNIDASGEVGINEEGDIETTVEIPATPADWSADLDATLYVDGTEVGTQPVPLSDDEATDVTFQHEFQQAGNQEVYIKIEGEATRDGPVSTISAELEATTPTAIVTIVDSGSDESDNESDQNPDEDNPDEDGSTEDGSSSADISISSRPTSVAPGDSATVQFSVTNTGENAPTGGIQFDTPAGITVENVFFTSGIDSGETITRTVNIDTNENMQTDTYSITVDATVGTRTDTASFDLTVGEDDGLSRFDQTGSGTIDFTDVIAAIEANNEGTEIGGQPVSFTDVINVIQANNQGTTV